MLERIAIILVLLWLVGIVSAYTLGGGVHVLLIAAVVLVIVRVVRGSDPLQ